MKHPRRSATKAEVCRTNTPPYYRQNPLCHRDNNPANGLYDVSIRGNEGVSIEKFHNKCYYMVKMKTKEKIKVRNWGNVTLHFKSGRGVHKDKSMYSRKDKHKNKIDR